MQSRTPSAGGFVERIVVGAAVNDLASAADSRPGTPLSFHVMAAYGAPAIMLAAFGITFYVYLPKFYADWVGIDLSVIGAIALLSRVWDAITDPTIGALSDRTRTPLGRRRPWMLIAAVPLSTAFYLLLVPPPTTGTLGGIRLAILAFVFFLFWTMVAVPYESLGAEISFDYDERNRLFGVREGLVLVGTLVGSALPAIFGSGSDAETASGFEVLGVGYGFAFALLVLWCAVVVRERRWTPGRMPKPGRWRGGFPLRKNQPFVILQVAYTIYALGAALAATMILFYVEHVLESDSGPIFLILYLGTGSIFLPVWVWLAKRWEKRNAWLLALAVNTSAFTGAAFLGPGDTVIFGVLVVLSAMGLGGCTAIPPSMQADVIDYDELLGRTRREGTFIGVWALAKKLAMAAGAGLSLPILDQSGYLVGGAVQPESAILALKWLYVGGPVICNLTAITIGVGYSIDRGRHQAIRAEIRQRVASEASEKN